MAARLAGTVGGGIASRLACASEAPRAVVAAPALVVLLASASAAVGQPDPGGTVEELCAAPVGTSTKTFPTGVAVAAASIKTLPLEAAEDGATAAAAPSVATTKSLGREAAAAGAGFPANATSAAARNAAAAAMPSGDWRYAADAFARAVISAERTSRPDIVE